MKRKCCSHKKSTPNMGTSSKTSTSTKANTRGNITVTGGAGKGATTRVTVNRSTPKMGVTNKKYKYPVPAMGLTGGKGPVDWSKPRRTFGTDIEDFFAGRKIGDRFKTVYSPEDLKIFQDQANKGLPPGAVRWGKGTYRMPGSDVSIPIMGSKKRNKVSVPRMGPVGASIGASAGGYIGNKIGKFIGSAGRVIGPNHRKYGEQAGQYIGTTLGSTLGGTFGLASTPF